LEIKLLDLIVTDLKKSACLDAFQALGAGTLRREEGKLADHMCTMPLSTSRKRPAGNHDKHGVGRIPFLEENLPPCARRVDVNGLIQSRFRSPYAASRTLFVS
jgi:hypothetical protein